jgi:hypothetical protein
MTKLLLNDGTTVLYTKDGAPIAVAGIVLADEVEESTAEQMTVVKLTELPEDAPNLSSNARAAVGDDATVTETPKKGAKS